MTLELAWEAIAKKFGAALPRAAAIAMAGPIGVGAEVLQLTNNPWVLRPQRMVAKLRLDRLTLVNDLGAVGHALGALDGPALRHVCGADLPLPIKA